MPKPLEREPQKMTVDEYFALDAGLPEQIEQWHGMIGSCSDNGLRTLRLDRPIDRSREVWLAAIAAVVKKA